MRIKKTVKGISAVALSTVLVACGTSDGSGDVSIEIDFATYAPQGHVLNDALDKWATDVEEKTSGRVSFDITYNAGLLAADDTLEGIRDRRADGGLVGVVYYETELPLTSITGVPYVTTHYPAAMRALMELSESNETLREEYEQFNAKPIFFLPASDSLFGSSSGAIMDISDLKGVSIRSVGTTTQTLEMVGANPVAIAFPEVYESLERGVVEAYAGVLLDSISSSALYEVAPYITSPQQGLLSTYAVSLNTDVWDSIEPADQQTILELGEDALAFYFENEAESLAEACEKIISGGGSVDVWTDEDAEEWASKIGDVVFEAWRDRAGGASTFEDQYLGLLKQYESEIDAPENAIQACADSA